MLGWKWMKLWGTKQTKMNEDEKQRGFEEDDEEDKKNEAEENESDKRWTK